MKTPEKGSLLLFKTRKNAMSRLGRLKDVGMINGGIRYAIERPTTGMFIENIADYIEGKSKRKLCTKWIFFMWLKPNRIVRFLTV